MERSCFADAIAGEDRLLAGADSVRMRRIRRRWSEKREEGVTLPRTRDDRPLVASKVWVKGKPSPTGGESLLGRPSGSGGMVTMAASSFLGGGREEGGSSSSHCRRLPTPRLMGGD
ncbi:hypothetical protein NL676_033256 [Syzygium grande]|nr:hypothetical protein NL676_033256 [Syzygium grande]